MLLTVDTINVETANVEGPMRSKLFKILLGIELLDQKQVCIRPRNLEFSNLVEACRTLF